MKTESKICRRRNLLINQIKNKNESNRLKIERESQWYIVWSEIKMKAKNYIIKQSKSGVVVTYIWCAVIDLIQALVLRFHWLIDLLCSLYARGRKRMKRSIYIYIYMQLQYRLAKFLEFWNARQFYGTRTQKIKGYMLVCVWVCACFFFFFFFKSK